MKPLKQLSVFKYSEVLLLGLTYYQYIIAITHCRNFFENVFCLKDVFRSSLALDTKSSFRHILVSLVPALYYYATYRFQAGSGIISAVC